MDSSVTCFECGGAAQENHHVIPKVMGGTKTIPLCSTCHGLAHMVSGRWENRSMLTKLGLQKAREAGVQLGRPDKCTDEEKALAKALHENGNSISSIARNLLISRSTVLRILST